MMEPVWDGLVRADALEVCENKARQELADAAKGYDWARLIDILRRRPELINTTRPGGSSLFSPLHQVAHGGAPTGVVEALIDLGAWRTLQNARGERPVDIAERRGHQHLSEILTPNMRRSIPIGILLKLQVNFHSVIRGRAEKFVRQHGLRLPELEPLLEFKKIRFWFAVPGMYGGFAYALESAGVEAKLACESWCRVVDGSGQRHEVTSAGSKLVEEGFV